jgi:hypothetical protein
MQNSLSMNTRSAERWKVILLFGAVGVLSAGVVLISFQLGLRGAISAITGLPFAAMILLGAWAVSNQGWLRLPRIRLANRDWGAGLLFALSQSVGLLLALAISCALTPPWFLDFDEHPVESFSRLELLQSGVAIPLGVFLGTLVTLLICVAAVNVLTGKWPKHSWGWALCASSMMTVIGMSAIALGSDRTPLFVWYSVLGTVIGLWICEAAEKTVEA